MVDYHIIPKTVELQPLDGFFELRLDTNVVADSHNQENAAYLRDFLATSMGYSLPVQGDTAKKENAITLKLDPALTDLGEEGYRLTVENSNVLITGFSPKGVFYGIQTLRQLLPVEIENRSSRFWGSKANPLLPDHRLSALLLARLYAR